MRRSLLYASESLPVSSGTVSFHGHSSTVAHHTGTLWASVDDYGTTIVYKAELTSFLLSGNLSQRYDRTTRQHHVQVRAAMEMCVVLWCVRVCVWVCCVLVLQTTLCEPTLLVCTCFIVQGMCFKPLLAGTVIHCWSSGFLTTSKVARWDPLCINL